MQSCFVRLGSCIAKPQFLSIQLVLGLLFLIGVTSIDETVQESAKGQGVITAQLSEGDLALAEADTAHWSFSYDEAMQATGLNGTGNCMGLKKKMCRPCSGLEYNDCSRVEKQCDNLFCSPMCLQLAWQCDVSECSKMRVQRVLLIVTPWLPLQKRRADISGASLLPRKRRRVSVVVVTYIRCGLGTYDTLFSPIQALCAQMIGHACADVFKCCEKGAALTEWVESYAFGAGVPLKPSKNSLWIGHAPTGAFPHPLVSSDARHISKGLLVQC